MNDTTSLPRRAAPGLAAGLAALALAGCAVTPKPLTDGEVRDRIGADQIALYADQTPISKPITFADALARALKYNLDFKLKQMESQLALGLQDVSRYEMLPRLLANAGYTARNNDSGGTSIGILTGQETLVPSYSVTRERGYAGIEFSWNALDFGLSYYRARQLSNQFLMAEERKRRVMQNIVQDVRSSYWRALGAQRLAGQADALITRVRSALERSREAEAQGLMPPPQALAYQRALLDATTLLSIRRQELEFAKLELAALMNVPPGAAFTLADVAEPSLPPVPTDIAKLENIAIEARPELREEDYRKRVTADEARRQLLQFIPNPALSIFPQYDGNSLLYNQAWIEGGIRLTMNLFRLAALPLTQRANEQSEKTDDARRLALSMAVLTQVRVSVQRYALAMSDVELADESNRVDQRLAQYSRVALTTRVDSELELIRTEARALVSQFQRYASYANAQTAFGRIYNTLGLDGLPADFQGLPVDDLAQQVAATLAVAERDAFPAAAGEKRELPPIAIVLEGADAVNATELAAAVRRALERNRFRVVSPPFAAGAEPWTLSMRLDLGLVRDGMRRAEWSIDLRGPKGGAEGSARYGSALAAAPTPSSLAAFAESAAVSQIANLRQWMEAEGDAQPKR